MRAGPRAPLAPEPEELGAAIEREALATEETLNRSAFLEHHAESELPGREELCRQLAALRDRVDRAWSATDDPREVRAELATLLFFAKTLRSDAETWRAGIRQAVEELERKRAAGRRERERAVAQQAEVMRRRQALQARIDHEAGLIAHQKRGECRRTLPVISLHPGLTVSSMTVSRARGRFRSAKLWLVTLDRAGHDVLVTRG